MRKFVAAIENYTVKGFADVDAKNLSSYRGGGVVRRVFAPESVGALKALLDSFDGKCVIVGNGTNTLVADGEVLTPVVLTRYLDSVVIGDDKTLEAEAGASVRKCVYAARDRAYGGLEPIAGIPATIGAALKRNAGAFLRKTGDYVTAYTVLTPCLAKNGGFELKRIEVPKGLCDNRIDGVVVSVQLLLEESTQTEIDDKLKQYAMRRNLTQPSAPSLGCAFKNADRPAGWYLERAGLKGLKSGGAQYSEVHANFIVNVGGGSAKDYLALVEEGKRRVFEQFGVMLEEGFDKLEN